MINGILLKEFGVIHTEDWEMDKGKELGINYEYDCIKSFAETENFNKLSAKYGLDSQVIVELCKTFASHVSIPKVKWDKYHEPYKDNIKEKQFSGNEILVNTVDPILPVVHFEKPPFPVSVKEHSFANSIVNKSSKNVIKIEDQIIVEQIGRAHV